MDYADFVLLEGYAVRNFPVSILRSFIDALALLHTLKLNIGVKIRFVDKFK